MNGQQDIWAQQAALAEARQEIEFFRRQTDGELNYLLACHAAVPEVLTPELLYLLRDNFKRDLHGAPLNIPWMAVSDLLLSNLCREIGYDTFELAPTVRKVLYENLERDPRFGKQRLLELSDFLMAYIRPLLMHQSPAQRREARRQRWVALSISHPELAAEEVAAEYQEYQAKGHRAGQGYIRRFLEKAPVRNAQLAVLERYVAGTNEWVYGHMEKAEEMLQGLGGNLQFGEVRLDVPQVEQEEQEEYKTPADELVGEIPDPFFSTQLRKAIYELDIDVEMGPFHLANVNREKQRDQFWDFFDKMKETPFQFYFLPGDPQQMPSLFAERMVYELIVEELDDDRNAIFYPALAENLQLKVNPLPIRRNLIKSQRAFRSFIAEIFNVQDGQFSFEFEEFIKTGMTRMSYKYVVLPFYVNEDEVNDHIFDYFYWIIQGAFKDSPAEPEIPTFLFFFIVNIKDRKPRESQPILSNLQNLTVQIEQSTLIEIFNPVSEKDLINWLMNLGERDLSKIEKLTQIFAQSLLGESRELYSQQRNFNMADIARLQELIYQLHNQ